MSQTLAPSGVLSQTFTTDAGGFQLDRAELYFAGAPSTNLTVHLFANPAGGTTSDGFVNVNGLPDLLGGGAGLSFTYNGTATQNYLVLDFTGADEVTLAPNTDYALEIWGGSANVFWRRAGTDTYAGGNLYQSATSDKSQSRFDVSGAGRRDAGLALFAVAIPEPGSAALLGAGATGLLLARRRRS